MWLAKFAKKTVVTRCMSGLVFCWFRVVVATCISSGMLCSLALPVGHFTHVFVDEAGQATEPECLVPMMLLAGSSRQVREKD